VPEVLSGGEIEEIGEPLRYPAQAMRTSENSSSETVWKIGISP
jgi:hypothetical protein